MQPTLFKSFSELCERVRATSKKLEKVSLLSSYLASVDRESLPIVCRLLSGHIFPRGRNMQVSTGYSTLVKVILEVTGVSPSELNSVYLRHGDLGETAEELFTKRVMVPLLLREIAVLDVYSTFKRMASLRGAGSASERKNMVRGLLLNCSPIEAKYLVKIFAGELRIGVVEGLVEEGVAKAFGFGLEEVRTAHLATGDIGLTASQASKGGLREVSVELMRPINFMLADTMQTAHEIFNYFKREIYVEFKYDGVRAQAHKKDDDVSLFSRRLEDISDAFPEIVDTIKAVPHALILDGEIVPFKDGRPLPFQELQRRLRRKALYTDLISEVPATFFVYDLLYLDGEALIHRPLIERRGTLESLELGRVILSSTTQVNSPEEILRLFERSKELGYEGLVVKDPLSPYTPGRRGKHWVKLKEELDTLDVVIVAAEQGHGKRAGLLSDYTFAVRDGEELKVVGKAYSGLTDEEILEMTERLKAITIEDQGFRRIVQPSIVLEVSFDSIQASDRHESGYALRFPRIKRLRYDKSPREIDTLDRIKEIFLRQRLGKAS